jgi:UDP-N-acetylglucosamine 4,6-dehydratase
MYCDFQGKNILVTGGTGSFGRAFISTLIREHSPNKIAVFSRDELKQQEMKSCENFSDQSLRWFIGDVRDKDRLNIAFKGIDIVVHAAALKQVDTGEYNPSEFIKTNILGSQNVVEAAIHNAVAKVLLLSTDKASSPINLYGATKLTADKLFVSSNYYGSFSRTQFSVVRYGNVLGSRGSVVPIFLKQRNEGKAFTITSPEMTRFSITLKEACEFVVDSLRIMKGGEIFVPKIPTILILDLLKAIDEERKVEVIGVRPGEKLHEEMISESDSGRSIRLKDRFIILNQASDIKNYPEGEFLVSNSAYRSDTNKYRLTVEEIRDLLNREFGM